MADSAFQFEIGPNKFICISPLNKELLEVMDVDMLGDEFGYFIYESDKLSSSGCTEVLAKCPNFESAYKLIEIYRTRSLNSPIAA